MSNRQILDPVEATFHDLRGAVYAADGHAAMSAIERRPDLHTLHYVGDGLRLALAQGVTGAARRAGEHIAALRNRDLDGDEDLAIELEAALGPMCRTNSPASTDSCELLARPHLNATIGGPRGSIDNPGRLWLYLAMRQVKIAELKNRLSEHLRAVENGAEVVVMDRNRPIARIVPLPPPGRRVRLLQPSRNFPDIRDRRRTRTGWQVTSTELLLEERRKR